MLSKIHLLEKAGRGDCKLYINISNSLQYESLSLLGVPPDRIINSAKHPFVAAGDVVVPYFVGGKGNCRLLKEASHPSGKKITMGNVDDCVGPATWICDYLRSNLLATEASKSEKSTRIYVSRNDATRGRKIINEEEFIKVIEKFGFEKVSLSGMSFREQINIFRNADFIIAPHGAGLANIIFCKPGATLIELFSSTYISDLFAVLSGILGIKYFYFVEKGLVNAGIERSLKDFKIDYFKFETILRMALQG